MAKYRVDIEGRGSFVVEVPDGSPPPTEAQVLAALGSQNTTPTKAEKPLTYENLRDTFAQGLTFGFADEAAASLGATGDLLRGNTNFAQNYDRRVAQHRADLHQAEKDHPAASFAMNVAGGIPWAYLTGGAGAPATGTNILKDTAWRAATSGAKAGAVAGAGAAEGGPLERAWGATKGAGAGFLTGAVLPTAMRTTTAIGQRLADSFADSQVGQWLGKLPGIRPPGGDRGVEKVAAAFEKDGLSPIQAAMRVDELSAGGKPAVLADAGRTATLRLGRDAINATPHGVADTVEQLASRADDAGPRVIEDLISTTGMRGDAQQVATALMQQRAAAAAPLYERAYIAGASPVTDPVILGMLGLPEFQQAVRAGYKLAAVEGVNLPAARDASGKVVRMPNLQVLDYVKRGLDDLLYSGRRTGTIGKGMMRALETRKQEFLSRLDTLFPDYARARAAYAGDTAMIEAVDLGQRFISMTPREVDAALAQLTTPGEKQHFLLGAVDAIKQAINASSDGADVVRRVWGNTSKRQKLESLFPSKEAFQEFSTRLAAEKRMRMTYDATRGNSTTAQQQVGLADLADNEAMAVAGQVANGNWAGLMERAMNRGRGNLGANAEAALPVLFGDPRRGLEQLVRARQLMQNRADAPMRSPVPAGIVSGLLTGR